MRQALAGLASKFLRSVSALPAVALAFAIAAPSFPAEAAKPANAKYAAIVVDANTGKTLFSESPDAQRFPASLTKMMTLYLTFEALKAGRISKATPVRFSAQAAAMPPTKLGIGAGRSVTVETAILALVTKSANDAAAALAELLGGSEQRFALMMTQKARGLGMTGTRFRNASGLPNAEQHTTARDMARLGLALRKHFPEYYAYFSTPSFKFGKQRLRNHNRLLGRVKGVDGIKTGYTNASGFNLVSSVTDGNRRIVAVVLGGTSGRARDDRMVQLIDQYLPLASPRRASKDELMASTALPSPALANAVLPTSDAPLPIARRDEAVVEEVEEVAEIPEVVTTPKEGRLVKSKKLARSSRSAPAKLDSLKTASVPQGSGWVIQIASAPTEAGAHSLLSSAAGKGVRAIASASAFTVPFKKGRGTVYRARFGGFGDKTAAWDACNALKKKQVDCFVVQQR